MLVLDRFLVIIHQVGNQYNMETFSLDTFQSVWSKAEVTELLLIPDLMRGPDRDVKTFNDYFAFFTPEIVTLFEVTELTFKVIKTTIKSVSLSHLSYHNYRQWTSHYQNYHHQGEGCISIQNSGPLQKIISHCLIRRFPSSWYVI